MSKNIYACILKSYISQGHADRIPYAYLPGDGYRLHYPVTHPCKPEKIRVA